MRTLILQDAALLIKNHPGRNQGENMRKNALPLLVQKYFLHVSSMLRETYAIINSCTRSQKRGPVFIQCCRQITMPFSTVQVSGLICFILRCCTRDRSSHRQGLLLYLIFLNPSFNQILNCFSSVRRSG